MAPARRLLAIGVLTILTVLLLSRPLMGQDLPDLKPLPLPEGLAQVAAGDDYADRLQTTPVGALVWQQFPVSVRIDLAGSTDARAKVWQQAVTQAITDWSPLIELTQTTAAADITIRRASLPLRRLGDGKLAPVRFADTRFEFYNQAGILRHRMVITLSPNQADRSLLSGARHELGHALGIWGHSDRPTDVMYSSQVAQPPQISDRDRATLRKVYGQSTRLGGSFPKMP